MADVGIVLSGGGARGAYEAGVVSGLVEALAPLKHLRAPFRVIAGTSVGAINGAWLAANAHRHDHGIGNLVQVWESLQLQAHLHVDLTGLLGFTAPLRFLKRAKPDEEHFGRSVLDPRAIEELVATRIDWAALHDNVASNRIKALVVAALHIGTGVTTLFSELAPGAEFRAMKHPRRVARVEPITAEHVLASAAIPALFPARRVGRGFFVDGGLRFNTPISSAIRAGADKLVVITLRHDPAEAPSIEGPGASMDEYPHLVFLIGKIFNALLLDPVTYDLQMLERFNRMMEVLDATLSKPERERVDRVLVESRGLPYRRLDTLTFEPSQDIGVMAGEHLREHHQGWRLGRFYDWLLARAANVEATWEADLASYLLFDGEWAKKLIALGRADALAKRDAIVQFFSDGPQP
jgi:NTE family protein